MNEHLDVFGPFRQWFRGLSRPMQWLLGPVIIVGGLWMFFAEVTHVPEPDEPRKAIWVTLILFVVVTVLQELLRPKPNIEDMRPSGLGDFQVPTTTEGRVVPLLWGRVRQRGPNVIWYGDLLQEAITEKVKTGLWSSERVTKGFKYHLGLQMAICRGGGDGVVLKRVWIGDDEVYSGTVSTNTFFDIDEPDLFGGQDLGSGGIQATVDFYVGSSTQPVSPYLDDASRQRITTATTPTAPRHTGTSYVVVREMTSAAPSAVNIGAYVGNVTSIKAWSFEIERFPSIFSGQAAGENKIATVDCNPVNAIYEILTDTEWGFGFPATDIDVGLGSTFLAAADTMITEANGFSMILDREISAKDLLMELQRQIDGVVFLDQSTGKWSINLARGGYSVGSLEQLTDSNVVEVRDYTRGSWEDTTNTISVEYDKRDDDYKKSFALAQDMANAMIQGDGTVANSQTTIGHVAFPGVKSSALAANLAWRELRGQSYPLARCQLVVNRQMWQLKIGDVVAWTNTQLGFTQLPMRITRIDYGRLESNRMTLTVVQDVFEFAAASMGTPPATGWTPPTTSLVAFPAAQQKAFEAPRAITTRDPDYSGDPLVCKIMAAARRQSGEVTFLIKERHAAGAPGGTYAEAGEVYQFTKIGQLKTATGPGQANPVASILMTATPDGQTALEAAFDDDATDTDLGEQLSQLVLIGNEFMMVKDAAISGSDVALQNVYRGALDTAQEDHAANTDIFLLHVGAGLTDSNFVNTNNVDVELRMRSASATFAGAVTAISLTMNKRAKRPYPVAAIRYNGTATDFGTPDAEGDGSGENGFGFDVDWLRRILDATDELAAMTADVDPDSHGNVTNTQYQLRVFVDPSGSNTEIASSPFAWTAGTGTPRVLRNELQEIAAAGTEIRVQIQSRHDYDADTNLTSIRTQKHDVVPTSDNDGLFYLGGNKRATEITNSYNVASAGVHTVRIGAAYSTSNVQARINGGGWSTIITAGSTSGTTASLSVSDTIELQHTVNEAPDPQFVEIENPSAARVAYGTFSA